MARSKTTGGKATRANTKQEATNTVNPASIPDVKAVAGGTTPAEVAAAEVRTAAPEPRKLEVVKSEPRKNGAAPNQASANLVPINLEDEIRRRAYELYQQRGATSGGEAEDWLTAEREVRQRYRQQSA